MRDLISIELAKELAKIGYSGICHFYTYILEGEDGFEDTTALEFCEEYLETNKDGKIYPRPYLNYVVDWFRQEFGYVISIEPREVSKYINGEKVDDDGIMFYVHIYKLDDENNSVKVIYKPRYESDESETYEECMEMAIKKIIQVLMIDGPVYKVVSYSRLNREFPGFVWWVNKKEICGVNFETRQNIVIEDGLCRDRNGKWLVHLYQWKELPQDWKKLKYSVDEEKLMEEWKELY